jgi:hypothetical protein
VNVRPYGWPYLPVRPAGLIGSGGIDSSGDRLNLGREVV